MAYCNFIRDTYKKYPPLRTYEDEREVVHKYRNRGDEEGWMAELVARNIYLANRMIISLTRPSEDALREDLLTVAIESLWKAVKRWNPDFGTKFASYAGTAIKNGIIKEISLYRDANSRTFSMNSEIKSQHSGEEMDNDVMDSLIRSKITPDTKITFSDSFDKFEDRDFQDTMFDIIMRIKAGYPKVQREKIDFAAKAIFDNGGIGLGYVELWYKLYPNRKVSRQRIDQIYNAGRDLIRRGIIKLAHSASVGENGAYEEWKPVLDRLSKFNVNIFSINRKYSHSLSALTKKFQRAKVS